MQFEIVEPARKPLVAWLERRGGTLNDFVFPSRKRLYEAHEHEAVYPPRSRVNHRHWPQAEDYGTHSLRRTKASIIYKATGKIRAVRILLGHAKIESTVLYLGVDVEDALELAKRTEV
ncbi:integrase [Sphingomonas sp. PAMC26645]|uniref:tyrosine-type recombinase/integrase n=1 Tax=Sphingomonas sp. PAMC26645 TaxID=2565555 RepID=UPI00109D88E4|nr:tyrosine-type recombinase/integrase [Sphingomonas sp. PAMC26645]QCB42626.1 integrase [Sphingomonas sp. PAMC26645]